MHFVSSLHFKPNLQSAIRNLQSVVFILYCLDLEQQKFDQTNRTIIPLVHVRTKKWSNRFALVRSEDFLKQEPIKRYFKFEYFISTKQAFDPIQRL